MQIIVIIIITVTIASLVILYCAIRCSTEFDLMEDDKAQMDAINKMKNK